MFQPAQSSSAKAAAQPRVLVVADLNPIVKVLEFSAQGALPALHFRMKLQQGSGDNAKAQYQIHLATFELTKTSDVSKPLTENGQAVISIEVYDKTGTTRDSVPTPTTFPAKSNDFAEASFGSVFISYVEDGKLIRKTPADFSADNKDKDGSVKFTSVSGDTVTGEADLKITDKITLKGNFTAKIVGKEF